MAQEIGLPPLENNGEFVRRNIKMFILCDLVIYFCEIIQQKKKERKLYP